jgi:hypothetical protein
MRQSRPLRLESLEDRVTPSGFKVTAPIVTSTVTTQMSTVRVVNVTPQQTTLGTTSQGIHPLIGVTLGGGSGGSGSGGGTTSGSTSGGPTNP